MTKKKKENFVINEPKIDLTFNADAVVVDVKKIKRRTMKSDTY